MYLDIRKNLAHLGSISVFVESQRLVPKSALCRWLGMCAAGKSAFLLGKGGGRAESHAPRHTLEKCWLVASRCFKALCIMYARINASW